MYVHLGYSFQCEKGSRRNARVGSSQVWRPTTKQNCTIFASVHIFPHSRNRCSFVLSISAKRANALWTLLDSRFKVFRTLTCRNIIFQRFQHWIQDSQGSRLQANCSLRAVLHLSCDPSPSHPDQSFKIAQANRKPTPNQLQPTPTIPQGAGWQGEGRG